MEEIIERSIKQMKSLNSQNQRDIINIIMFLRNKSDFFQLVSFQKQRIENKKINRKIYTQNILRLDFWECSQPALHFAAAPSAIAIGVDLNLASLFSRDEDFPLGPDSDY